jgi:hypothetical protein
MSELVIKEYPEYKQWIELMHEWGTIPEGQMKIEEQLTRLEVSFPISDYKLYIEDTNGEEHLVTMPLFKIQDVRIKSKRIIRMGDYYFTINPQFLDDPQSALKFFNKLDDGAYIKAHHPHINDNGQPCLGEFQRHLCQLIDGNILYIVKAARKFLKTHNYRSTFHNLREYYDVDIIGILKRAELDNNLDPIDGTEITEKIRVMGWKLSHEIRCHNRTSRHSSGRPLFINSYRSGKIKSWIVRLMKLDLSFTQAAKTIRKLQNSLDTTEIDIPHQIEEGLKSLSQWSYYKVNIGNISFLHHPGESVSAVEIARIYLNESQQQIVSTFRALRGNDSVRDYMENAPWPDELSDEEIQNIIATGEWPDGILSEGGDTNKVAYMEAIFLWQSLVEEGKTFMINKFKNELKRLGEDIKDEPIEVTDTRRNGTENPILLEDLPRF